MFVKENPDRKKNEHNSSGNRYIVQHLKNHPQIFLGFQILLMSLTLRKNMWVMIYPKLQDMIPCPSLLTTLNFIGKKDLKPPEEKGLPNKHQMKLQIFES